MAAQRIRAANSSGLPRCKSEGTLIDLSEGFSESSFNDVKVPSPSALLADNPTPFGNAKEVVAIKDYCPTNFTTLKFSKGDHLYVLDTSGGEWWYAHNTTEMGYIPSSYVQPLNYRNSTLSDSGMIDNLPDSPDETNPFLNGNVPAMPSVDELTPKSTVDLLLFDTGTSAFTESSSATTNSTGDIFDELPATHRLHTEPPVKRDNPFFRSKRLKSPAPEQFQSREDFRAAWLSHRKLARSCHDLDLLGQSPGWGQTQAVETNIVCKLDSSGGAVQLPDTNISIHVPEGHVAPGETQQISMKALLDPPLELNSDRCSSVSPVLEVKLSTLEVKTHLILEMKVSAEVKNDIFSKSTVGLQCLRSDSKEGPYVPIPLTYSYGDTVQVQLDNLEPCMYLAIVAHGPNILYPSTVWDFIHKKVTTLLVSEVTRQAPSPAPVALQLWGKHQFVLSRPQDLQVCMFSNMTNYENPGELSDFTLRVQRRFLKKNEVGKIILSPFAATTKYPTFQDRPVSSLKFGKLLKTVVRQSKNHYLLEYKKGDTIALLSEEKVRLKGQLWTKEWYIGYHQGRVGLVHAKNVLVVGKARPSLLSGPELSTSVLLEQILRPCKFLTYIYASVRTLLMENVSSWRSFADALGYGDLPLTCFCRAELDSEPERVASVLEKLKEDCNNTENKDRKSFQKELMMGFHMCPEPQRPRLGLSSRPCSEPTTRVSPAPSADVLWSGPEPQATLAVLALLKMDCQGLVVRLIQDFVLLTTAVEVAQRWRELAEKLAKVSKQQMDAYESPHRDRNGVVDSEAMWKPAYDFLLTWSHQVGDSYRDVIQELHLGLDKMKNPITKRWKHLTGTLILVNSLDILRAAAFSPVDHDHDDFVI
ncbi:SH3 domain-binding protein 4 [Camelus ferus]|nr:SH3 domain-binding protein 4 [Camelus ferus]